MELAQQLLGVLFVFGMLGLAVWMLRRKTAGLLLPARSGKRDAHLESAARLALTPQHTLHLVRAGGRELLVVTHPQGCTLLTEQASVRQGAVA